MNVNAVPASDASREEKQFLIMTQTPVGKLIAKLAVPTVISMLVSAIYNITDTFYVSHLGPSAAGAVGVVFSLMSLIQAFGMGMGTGAASMVSRCLGRRDVQTASRYVSSAFFAGALIGLCILTAGELNLRWLMRLLGSTDTILPYACDYGHYILIAAPIMCAAFVLNTTLRAEGKAVFSMIGLTTGAILNIAIAPIFIYVLDWGIGGAALAVLVCQCISLCILLSFFIRKKSVTTLSFKLISRDRRVYWDLIRLGSPTTLRQGFASLAMALLNVKSAPFGDAAVAAVSIVVKIYLAIRSIILGIGQALQPVAGYNHGAKLYDRVRGAFWVTTRAGTLICLCFAGRAGPVGYAGHRLFSNRQPGSNRHRGGCTVFVLYGAAFFAFFHLCGPNAANAGAQQKFGLFGQLPPGHYVPAADFYPAALFRPARGGSHPAAG